MHTHLTLPSAPTPFLCPLYRLPLHRARPAFYTTTGSCHLPTVLCRCARSLGFFTHTAPAGLFVYRRLPAWRDVTERPTAPAALDYLCTSSSTGFRRAVRSMLPAAGSVTPAYLPSGLFPPPPPCVRYRQLITPAFCRGLRSPHTFLPHTRYRFTFMDIYFLPSFSVGWFASDTTYWFLPPRRSSRTHDLRSFDSCLHAPRSHIISSAFTGFYGDGAEEKHDSRSACLPFCTRFWFLPLPYS